jgi:23S rRNA (cytidine1920-2'-O)/16S rRNA (cytidine1409-2'-O)-methyltransferase
MARVRLDIILVNKGLFESREKAKAAVMAGLVYVDGERADKPGAFYSEDCTIEVKAGEASNLKKQFPSSVLILKIWSVWMWVRQQADLPMLC